MIDWFKPTWMVNTIYNVSPKRLQQQGITAIFSDLDNTLIAWNDPNATRQLKRWAEFLRKHQIKLVVVSNNTHRRVSKALKGLNLPFVSWSMKPSAFGIKRALRRYHLKRNQIVMVGDQLMTDVWAAHNAHVKSIWVKPLIKTDKWNTRINRFFERRIYHVLKRKNRRTMIWRGDINDKK
ncbi:MAG: YqeG family HAD IIIA-type phosphatase [Acetilactobacillus jinshanensis]